VVSLLNNDDFANKYFTAATLGATGGGAIDLVNDGAATVVTSGGQVEDTAFTINLATDASGNVTTTAADLITFLESDATAAQLGISASLTEGNDGSGVLSATESDITFATEGETVTDAFASGAVAAVGGVDAQYTITARNAGAAYEGVTIAYTDTLSTAGNEVATYDAETKQITVSIKSGAATADQVITAINSSAGTQDLFQAVEVGAGTAAVDLNDTGTLTGGTTTTGSVRGAAFQGNEDVSSSGLTFESIDLGSSSFVSVNALSGSFSLTNTEGTTVTRNTGADVVARINGIEGVGNGSKTSINTSSLDISLTIAETVNAGESLNFDISGGGALFQIGPDVVSNQQARLGIQSVSTATLGGVSGRLFELRSGGAKSLQNDSKGAAQVVEEVIGVVTQLRGRLGAFQKTTLDANIFTLQETLANLTEAESAIRDADFAKESAKLTRAQILVQSGTSVLSIANQNPQNVLALLR